MFNASFNVINPLIGSFTIKSYIPIYEEPLGIVIFPRIMSSVKALV